MYIDITVYFIIMLHLLKKKNVAFVLTFDNGIAFHSLLNMLDIRL